jgi:hypothetical protein
VAGGLDTTDKPRLLQNVEVVIHGLGGERAEALACGLGDGLRIPMLSLAEDGGEYGQSRACHPETRFAKGFVKLMCVRRHIFHYKGFSGMSQWYDRVVIRKWEN